MNENLLLTSFLKTIACAIISTDPTYWYDKIFSCIVQQFLVVSDRVSKVVHA